VDVRVAHVACQLEGRGVVAQLVLDLGPQEVGDRGCPFALGKGVRGVVEPVECTGEVAGSTSNPPDVEARASRPDGVGLAIQKRPGEGSRPVGIAVRRSGAEVLAVALADAASDAGRRLPVLIQVNLAGSPGQRGVAPDGVEDLARALVDHPSLALQGLMTIAPAGAPPGVLRDHFRGVRELRDQVARRLGVELPHLSMGMSDDFSLAVEEGATFVRLGRALFGPRGSRSWREGA
jgi:hypothetical protein